MSGRFAVLVVITSQSEENNKFFRYVQFFIHAYSYNENIEVDEIALKESGGSIMDNRADIKSPQIRIKIIGIGGAGISALGRLIEDNITNQELIAINTDARSLGASSSIINFIPPLTLAAQIGMKTKVQCSQILCRHLTDVTEVAKLFGRCNSLIVSSRANQPSANSP